MIAPGPELRTERLILRPTAVEDLEGFIALAGDPETARFIGGVQPPMGAWRQWTSIAGAWTLTGVAMFTVLEAETGRFAGRLGPWRPYDWPGPEVGWGLLPEFWGRGYALEGARAAIDYAFDVLGWTEVIHCISPANLPSQRLAQRLGSKLLRQGVILPAPMGQDPLDIWGQSAQDWRPHRAG